MKFNNLPKKEKVEVKPESKKRFTKWSITRFCLKWGFMVYVGLMAGMHTYQIVYPHYVWAVNQRIEVIDIRYQAVLTSPVSAQE